MDDGKKKIRAWTWGVLVLFILGFLILIGAGAYLGTINNLLTSWQFYVSSILVILSLIGLFMYKKWGFYVFSLYLIYLLIENVLSFNFTRLIIFIAIYGYLIWFRAFYKNLGSFN